MDLEDFFEVFGDGLTRNVFENIVFRRSISHKRLVDMFDAPPETVIASVDRLRKFNLVDASNSLIQDLATYYVTEDGFSAYRNLEKLKIWYH